MWREKAWVANMSELFSHTLTSSVELRICNFELSSTVVIQHEYWHLRPLSVYGLVQVT
ncbi:hypothetical protein PPNK14_14560 [Pectobacterium parmentieri]